MKSSLLFVFTIISFSAFAQSRISIAEEKTLFEKMKADGLSDAMINKLIGDRKELMKSGRNIQWSNIKNIPTINSVCNMSAENGWDSWNWLKGTNSNNNPPVWSGSPALNPVASDFSITSGTGIDANTPGPNPGDPTIPVVCPGFGAHSIKMGDSCIGGSVCQQLIFQLTVTTQDTDFVFAYAEVVQNSGHLGYEQPFVSFNIFDATSNPVPGASFIDTGSAILPSFYGVSTTGCAMTNDIYKPWTPKSVNLSAYIGQTVTIVITNADCVYGGHFAYSYWDFSCGSVMYSSISSTPVTCLTNNGTATVNVFGGTPPFTYLWSNGQTAQTATGLSAGTYSVTVTDSTGLISNSAGVVSNPAFSASANVFPVSCFGGSNGNAVLNVTGGLTPYTYLWNNGNTTAAISGVSAGSYSVFVTDASGCTATTTALVTGAPMLITNANNTPSSCWTCPDASAVTNVIGGTSPYTYLWSNGETTANIIGITQGSYTVCVTDANGCSTCSTVNILSLDVNEILNSSASVFPNPSPGNISIDFGNKNFGKASVTFSNLIGQILFETNIPATGKQMMDVSGFVDGVYFMKIGGASGIVTKKIIVSK